MYISLEFRTSPISHVFKLWVGSNMLNSLLGLFSGLMTGTCGFVEINSLVLVVSINGVLQFLPSSWVWIFLGKPRVLALPR